MVSVIFRDFWHMCRYEASLSSKVCFGSPYILSIAQLSPFSKELCSSREPQKTSRNLCEQHIKHRLQNNYCLYFHLCMTGHMQSPSSDQQAVAFISCVKAGCSSRMRHELLVEHRLTPRTAPCAFLRSGCIWGSFRKTLLRRAADLQEHDWERGVMWLDGVILHVCC